MSLFEKLAILGSIAAIGGYSVYQVATTGRASLQKDEIQKKRDEIVKNKNVKLLYSTMTFLYLQGFEQESLASFFTLHDILQITKPNYVALQLSEKEYKDKYLPVIQHPAFPEAMKKVEFYLKIKSPELATIKEFDLKDLEKLYMVEYCKINKCQIIFGDVHRDELDRQCHAKLQLLKLARQKETEVPPHLRELYEEQLQAENERAALLLQAASNPNPSNPSNNSGNPNPNPKKATASNPSANPNPNPNPNNMSNSKATTTTTTAAGNGGQGQGKGILSSSNNGSATNSQKQSDNSANTTTAAKQSGGNVVQKGGSSGNQAPILLKKPSIMAQTEDEIHHEIYVTAREEAFVEALMKELKPKYSVIPQNPYKTLLGLTEPQFVDDISLMWKSKFKTTYGHEIIEGEADEDEDTKVDLNINNNNGNVINSVGTANNGNVVGGK